MAVSADGVAWVLLNTSPDLRQQINETPHLGSVAGGKLRNSPIKAAVVTNGDVDHVTGLINLREAQPFSVYGSKRVMDTLAANSIFNVLAPGVVARNDLPMDRAIAIEGPDGPTGITVEAFDVPGKVALYLEDASAGGNFGSKSGDTIGLKVSAPASGKHFFYVPGCAELDAALRQRLLGATLVLFDGTLYTDDEMLQQGLMPKTGARMGHISISGPQGSIEAFKDLNIRKRIYVHINNSNPVLNENSPERKATEQAGWDVGYDGMEISL